MKTNHLRKNAVAVLAAVFAAVLLGWATPAAADTMTASVPAAAGAAAMPPTAPAFVSLDAAGARRLVAPAAHRAPTILALWSAECVHCKKNLALFAAMAQAEPGLRLITLAVEPAEPQLGAILERFGVPGERFAYGDEAPERLAFAIDPDWRGELPRTLFFDGRGGAVAVSGVLGEARVRELLGLGAAEVATR